MINTNMTTPHTTELTEKPKSSPEYDKGWNDAIKKYKEVWLPKALATQRQSLLDEVMGVIGEDDEEPKESAGHRNYLRMEQRNKFLSLIQKYKKEL